SQLLPLVAIRFRLTRFPAALPRRRAPRAVHGVETPGALGRSSPAHVGEMSVLLELNGLRKSFGGVAAVAGASFGVAEGSITAVIGPNGAGKSTVFNLASGLLRPDAGSIRFDGE